MLADFFLFVSGQFFGQYLDKKMTDWTAQSVMHYLMIR